MNTRWFLRLLISAALALPVNSVFADANSPIEIAQYQTPIRVACLGDSITFGVGAENGWAYPDQLDRMMGDKFDVRNFGHSGATVGKSDKHAIWGTKQYKDALAWHPDVVVIMLGTNDTKPENWSDKDKFPKLYLELIESFKKLSSKPRVFCCTAPYVGKKGAFGINEAGVLEEIPMILDVAKKTDAGAIDVHAALQGKDELFKDNVHPSTSGATLIAKAVYQSLNGKAYEGEIPGPKSVHKEKPIVRIIENPGDLSYRDAYTLINTCGIPPEKLEAVKAKYDSTEPGYAAKVAELEGKIAENDSLRMKYKKSDPKQSGEYKSTENALKKELEKYKHDSLVELIGLVPKENKGALGTIWLNQYIADRLAPLGTTVTEDQRAAIKRLCAAQGEAFGAINNTPERSVANIETYRKVYDSVLTAEQKKRVEEK